MHVCLISMQFTFNFCVCVLLSPQFSDNFFFCSCVCLTLRTMLLFYYPIHGVYFSFYSFFEISIIKIVLKTTTQYSFVLFSIGSIARRNQINLLLWKCINETKSVCACMSFTNFICICAGDWSVCAFTCMCVLRLTFRILDGINGVLYKMWYRYKYK